MRWNQIIFPFVTKSYLLLSSHRVSSFVHVHHSLVSRSCVVNSHAFYCSLNKRHIPVNNISSVIVPECEISRSFTHIWIRGYAKGKDRGRDKKKSDKGKKKVEINDEQLGEVIKIDTMRTQMQKAVDRLKDEYVKNLSLRSTTGSIETLEVSLEGKQYELQELAQVVRKDPKTIVINMTTFPQAIPAALEAIQKSGMNLNPQQDGTTLFIPIPKVTKEHRENLAKNAKALFIKCKDSVREVQNKFVKNVKGNTDISQDLARDVQEQIITIGDQYISEGEKIFEAKQTELVGKD